MAHMNYAWNPLGSAVLNDEATKYVTAVLADGLYALTARQQAW